MAGDISSYFKGGPPQGEQLSPTCRHEVECDVRSTSSWREIFAVARCGAGSTPPTLGVNFVRAVQNIITIEYTLAAYRGGGSLKGSRSENATLTLGQDLRKLGLGAVVWDCGEDIAAFLGRNRHLVMGTKVLDLGTGTGIAGLAAAQCGARQTSLTDHPALGPLVRSNIERNAPGFAAGCVGPTFVPFNWDNHTQAEAMELAAPDDPFDIILASDSLYDPEILTGFRKALAVTCGPRTVILMAYKRRLDSREKEFFEHLEEDFHFEVAGAGRGKPLPTSEKGLEPGSPSNRIAAERGVYLLLGTRRRNRAEQDRHSPLEKWRHHR